MLHNPVNILLSTYNTEINYDLSSKLNKVPYRYLKKYFLKRVINSNETYVLCFLILFKCCYYYYYNY